MLRNWCDPLVFWTLENLCWKDNLQFWMFCLDFLLCASSFILFSFVNFKCVIVGTGTTQSYAHVVVIVRSFIGMYQVVGLFGSFGVMTVRSEEFCIFYCLVQHIFEFIDEVQILLIMKSSSCWLDVLDICISPFLERFYLYVFQVNAVKFNEYATVVVSAGYDQSVRAWDCRSHSTEPIQVTRLLILNSCI